MAEFNEKSFRRDNSEKTVLNNNDNESNIGLGSSYVGNRVYESEEEMKNREKNINKNLNIIIAAEKANERELKKGMSYYKDKAKDKDGNEIKFFMGMPEDLFKKFQEKNKDNPDATQEVFYVKSGKLKEIPIGEINLETKE